jgi:heat shock protein HslJ
MIAIKIRSGEMNSGLRCECHLYVDWVVLTTQQPTTIGRNFTFFPVASFLLLRRIVFKPSSFVSFLLLALTVSSACSSASSALTTPSSVGGSTSLTSEQLSGEWTLTSIQPAGSAQQPAPASAIYSMTLDGEHVSSRVDCNRCGGQMRLTGTTLTLGPALACTRAACPTMDFETAYLSVLSGDSQASTDANTLTLSSQRGVLRFRR